MPFLFTSSSEFFSVAYSNRWLLIGGVRIDYFANKQQFVMHDSFSIPLNKPFVFCVSRNFGTECEGSFSSVCTLLYVTYFSSFVANRFNHAWVSQRFFIVLQMKT